MNMKRMGDARLLVDRDAGGWRSAGAVALVQFGQSRRTTFVASFVLSFVALMLASNAAGAYFTNNTDWAGANWTLANGDVVGGIHTNVGQFSIPSGAIVTVQPYAAAATNMGRVTVFSASADIAGTLSANGSGYPFNQGPGKGSFPSSNGSSGAGYGGRGSIGFNGLPGDFYGNPFAPVDLGSGGAQTATYGDYKQSGGGAIQLAVAGSLAVGGTLSANGNNGTSRSSGGSGGSVWLKAATVTGTGSILADGGSAADLTRGSGGGGGRIAIDSANNLFAGVIRAEGKPGVGISYHGTFNFQSGPDKDLVITQPIALPPGTNWVFRSLTVQSGVRFDIQSMPGTAGQNYTNGVATRIHILQNVNIPSGATMSANGLGYRCNEGPGAGTSANAGCGGGAYGGRGGVGDGAYPGDIYGAANAPDRIGSGGGGTGGTPGYGGNGGGAILLAVDGTLTVNGTLSANGDKSNSRSGGGSGGSVWLAATTLTGSGAILADGGVVYSTTTGGGGGGGRLAFDVENDAFTGTIRAKGQVGFRGNGRNGTFNFPYPVTQSLIVSNDIALPPGTNWVFQSLTVTNGARFEIQSVPGTASGNYTNAVASRIKIAGNVRVAAGSTIAADGLGHLHGEGEGRGVTGANSYTGGGGYGGHGGMPLSGAPGTTYGSPERPDRLGSGAGKSVGNCGGAGGGAVILDAAGTLSVAGTISAHGGGANYRSGGGSGGSIWLKAAVIEGQGTIAADGGKGAGSPSGGGGGGGRIALHAPQNDFAGIIRAKGSPEGRSRGTHGTFNFESDENRDLVIAHDIALPPGTNWVFRSLTITNGATFEIQSLSGTATLTYTNEVASRLRVLNDLTVASNACLSADSLGYRYTTGPGAGTVDVNGGAGGSYGGLGGAGGAGSVKSTYGDPLEPDRLGSGGAGSYGGWGGGALILEAGGRLTVKGTLTANGGNSNSRAGGGSGGAIWLKAPVIAGRGLIGANGALGYYETATTGGGGGGGGRILLAFGCVADLATRAKDAVVTETKPGQLAYSGAPSVNGGTGFTTGAVGTVRYLFMPPPAGTLLLVR
jgi:hypothetical protein